MGYLRGFVVNFLQLIPKNNFDWRLRVLKSRKRNRIKYPPIMM